MPKLDFGSARGADEMAGAVGVYHEALYPHVTPTFIPSELIRLHADDACRTPIIYGSIGILKGTQHFVPPQFRDACGQLQQRLLGVLQGFYIDQFGRAVAPYDVGALTFGNDISSFIIPQFPRHLR